MTSRKQKVKYIYSENLLKESERNFTLKNRASMVHELVKSFGLLTYMECLTPMICNYKDLRNFHSMDYLSILKYKSENDFDEYDEDKRNVEFGLGYDCPVWSGIFNYVSAVAGSTITAAKTLSENNSPNVVINWFGGWHHAHRDKAGGFCYINDVVLGILELRKKFKRILYIDLDIHHGDGVQEAFETSKHVFTLSFHQFECGFYPGTGTADDCGFSTGKGYAVNFPFFSGMSGKLFEKYFKRITKQILDLYQPEAYLLQCGADVIVGDPLGSSNLTPLNLIECVKFILDTHLPTIIVGGGGYHFPNTSRYWAQITALACNKKLPDDIPEENEFFLEYGPDYCLEITPKCMIDNNTESCLENTAKMIEANLEKYDVKSS